MGEDNAAFINRVTRERDTLVKALEKIRDESWTPADLEIRDCKQPEMIWQSVARRALASVKAGYGGEVKENVK